MLLFEGASSKEKPLQTGLFNVSYARLQERRSRCVSQGMKAKPVPPAKKKRTPLAGQLLDIIGWGVREAALPVPDFITGIGKKKTAKKK